MSDEMLTRLENLYSFLNTEGFYTKANTALLAKERIINLENELILNKASYDGVSSLLLSVQRDCVKESKKVQILKAMLRVNILRWYPNMTHEEVENRINSALDEITDD